jgi:hypothetical protein
LSYFGWRPVAQAGVRAVVVAVDVGGDLGACVVEGLELGAPDEPLLEVSEPRFDERLALGVAVAAAAVGDAEFAQAGAEGAARSSARRLGGEGCIDDRWGEVRPLGARATNGRAGGHQNGN